MDTRVKTGVAGLDTMLNGGFVRESSVLLRGAPGTGKTTLALQYLLEGAQHGEPGLFISFEEFPQSIYRDAESLGWDLKAHEAKGHFRMMFTSPEVLLHSLEQSDSPLITMIMTEGIQRIALDSITHFTRLSRDNNVLRHLYNTVINGFKREGVTAVFLGEETRSDFTSNEKGHLPFVVDCIIMMRYLEIESAIQRAIVVLKMRSSDHDKAIRGYTIGQGGMTVGDPLEGHVGLLSGLSRHSMISSVQTAHPTR